MVVFMVASMLIVTMAAAPSILTEGRREKEEEMIWRGKQYQRAIGLYYRKFGKYPTRTDDLVKQTNGIRFLRQAYTDPMNKEDGSWRFIYVGPNGQLIGSLRQTSLQQLSLTTPGLNPGPGLSGGAGGTQPQGPLGQNQGGGAGLVGQQTNSGSTQNSLESQPQPLTGDVLGGNIIGVGSKIKKSSIRVYLGGDTYEQWEFIWNPLTLGGLPGQGAPPLGQGIGTGSGSGPGPAPYTPGTSPGPTGQPPTTPTQ
jgi:hypothetical protein